MIVVLSGTWFVCQQDVASVDTAPVVISVSFSPPTLYSFLSHVTVFRVTLVPLRCVVLFALFV